MSKPESDRQQANVVRPEHEDAQAHVEGEVPSFAIDRPESIPKLHVPGLSPDATSLPPEALRADVPTLTDPVLPDDITPPALPLAVLEAPPTQDDPPTDAPPDAALSQVDVAADALVEEQVQEEIEQERAQAVQDAHQAQAPIETQEAQPEADTWGVQMQIRIEKLTEEIHSLNDRLDRFEKLPKV